MLAKGTVIDPNIIKMGIGLRVDTKGSRSAVVVPGTENQIISVTRSHRAGF